MAKKKKSSSNTLEMFKAWLSGVEEMQGPDWTPTAEQWKKIRNKIDEIEDEQPTSQQLQPQFPLPIPHLIQTPGQQPAYMHSGLQPAPIDPNNPPPVGDEFV